MRPTRTTALTAVVLAGALGLAGCGASSSPKTKAVAISPVAAVRSASANTVKAGSATFTMRLDLAGSGATSSVSGSGAFDYAKKIGAISVQLPSALTQGKNVKVDEVVTPTALYMSGALFGQTGKWVKVDVSKLGLSGLANQTDPSQMTKTLDAITAGTKVGPETVDGVKTTHYRGSLDATKAYAVLSGKAKDIVEKAGVTLPKTIPFDAWVDSQGRLVKGVEDFSITANHQTQQMHLQMGLKDFGKPVSVHVPSGSELVRVPGIS